MHKEKREEIVFLFHIRNDQQLGITLFNVKQKEVCVAHLPYIGFSILDLPIFIQIYLGSTYTSWYNTSTITRTT